MAIGGSITLTTQASPRNTPCHTKPVSHQGAPSSPNQDAAASSTAKNAFASIWDGTFAPRMVTQNTPPSRSNMIGRPSQREVTSRSTRWSKSHRGSARILHRTRGNLLRMLVQRLDHSVPETAAELTPKLVAAIQDGLGACLRRALPGGHKRAAAA